MKKNKKIQSRFQKSKKQLLLSVFIVMAITAIGVVILQQSSALTTSFVYYNQRDARWANLNYPYKPGTTDQRDIKIIDSGCGPTAMAMVTSSLSRRATPNEIAAWYGTRYHTSSGTDAAVYPVFAADYNLNYAALGAFTTTQGRKNVQNVLNNTDSLVIIHAGNGGPSKRGIFTSTGHILVMTSYNAKANTYAVADPYSYSNNRTFTEAELLDRGYLNQAYGFSSR